MLSGCALFRPSETWNKVCEMDIPGKGVNGESRSYAEEMQRRLAAQGIKNKVVTFRYTVWDRAPQSFTQSAVIYKDKATPIYPYWYVSNLTSVPVWLPNGSVAKQVGFVMGRAVEIIDVDEPGSRRRHKGAHHPPALDDNEKWNARFRKLHGTDYNPLSSMDREKMALMRGASESGAPARKKR
jgi:hypothetical protein